LTVILRLINMVYTNDKGPGSMSHLFVLERMTAHIIMRGQIKFTTRLPVLCSVLLFLIRIIKQRFEGHNSFSLLVCVLSEAKEMEEIMIKLIYHLTLHRSKCYLIQKYGKVFWKKFKANSDKTFAEILPQVPDIGDSIFSFSYEFGPSYIAWYKSFLELGSTQDEIIQNIWTMNEMMVTTIPRPFLKATGKIYLNGFRKKAATHVTRQVKGNLHPFDWAITYREINQNSFELDITECGLKKLAHQFKADGLLPGICRMDYLLANLMGTGFVRTKTLGDGDDCCNCHYDLIGKCNWSPEKGFTDRK